MILAVEREGDTWRFWSACCMKVIYTSCEINMYARPMLEPLTAMSESILYPEPLCAGEGSYTTIYRYTQVSLSLLIVPTSRAPDYDTRIMPPRRFFNLPNQLLVGASSSSFITSE